MLRENDLSRYSSLKFLYLTDNMINKIHQDAFFYNTDLRVLDLSLNGIIKLPPQVLQLPSLEKLFLSKNANMNIIDAVDKAKPISSPLKELDIGFNEIDTLPDFGMMPHLVKLNITGNPEVEMSLKSFAGLCNLQILSMDNVTAVFEDPCECWILEKWLRDRNVMFSSWECPSLEEDGKTNDDMIPLRVQYIVPLADCTMRVPGHHLKTFSQCKDKYEKIILNSKLIKILVPIAVAILILLLAAAYIIVKRKRRQAKMLRMKCASVDGQTLIR